MAPVPLGAESAGGGDPAGPGEISAPPAPGLPLPLSLVLEAAYAGAGRWRPDWPREIPPDAFTVRGDIIRIDLEFGEPAGIGGAPGEGSPQEGAPQEGVPLPGFLSGGSESPGPRYRLAWDPWGRPTDFPLALPGNAAFAQVRARYDEEGGMAGFDIEFPAAGDRAGAPSAGDSRAAGEASAGETPGPRTESVIGGSGGSGAASAARPPAEATLTPLTLSAHFPAPYLPGRGTPPVEPVTVRYGERLYYVLFGEGGDWISETWFDPWGNCIAYVTARTGPEDGAAGGYVGGYEDGRRAFRILGLEGDGRDRDLRYESGGNLSACSGEGGNFSALYDARGRPRYWKAEREYGLQWDEGGLLADMRDLGEAPETGAGEAPEGLVFPVDFRYEYEVDSRGNWVVRREIVRFRRGKALLPAYSRELVRHISYAGGEEGGGLD